MARTVKKSKTSKKKTTTVVKKTARNASKPKSRENLRRGELSSVPRLILVSVRFYAKHWKPLGFIVLVHSIVLVFFLRSAEAISIDDLRDLVSENVDNSLIVLPITALVALTFGEETSASFVILTLFLLTLTSLASIWMVRRLYAEQKFVLRDAFYRGTYPLVPYLLLVGLTFLQAVPFFAGSLLFSIVSLGGIATSFWQQIPFLLAWVALSALSGYMISLTIMSLYAVTLPDMRPLDATRAVRRVIVGKRWRVLVRIIVLAIVIVLYMILGFITLVALRSSIAFQGLDVLVAVLVPFMHIYLFHLYKEIV